MIPILYAKNDNTLAGCGVGFLIDAIKCTVTEERNGAFELSMQYPTSGRWFSKICEGALIKAKPNDTSKLQYFRIYRITRPINQKVTCYAEHISYDLDGYPLAGFSVIDATPAQAINQALLEAEAPERFVAVSDIDTVNQTSIVQPCSVRAFLGGQANSVLDVWGGEYEFDNFAVKLHKHRGKDNGVAIRYSKNLMDLKEDSDISGCYTHIMPYAVVQDPSGQAELATYVYLAGEKTIQIADESTIGRKRVYKADLTGYFAEGEEINEAALRIKSNAYAATCDLNTRKVSLSVSFTPLWKTEEYKQIAPLEQVNLCDEVSVYFAELGVGVKTKVIKTVYDSLKERYEKIDLGSPKSNFAKTVVQLNNSMHDMGNYLLQTFTASNGVLKSQIKLLSGAAQYVVGERSPSDGLTAGAASVLRDGMIYVPIASHEEGISSFELGTAYRWNGNEIRWDELQPVFVDAAPEAPDNGALAYFSTEITPYQAGYLYVYDSATKTWGSVASTYDDYQTIAMSLLQQTVNAILARVSNAEGSIASMEIAADRISGSVQDNAGAIAQLQLSAGEAEMKIADIRNNGVSAVTTSTGYKFGADGLQISREGEEIANTIDHTGMSVKRGEEDVLIADKEGVNALNLTARQYLNIGNNSRLEDYESNRTACFWIGESS